MSKPIERHYFVGLPVCVSVDNLGRVTFDVDLAEVDGVREHIEVDAPWHEADIKTLSEAAARIGNCLTVMINPTIA